MDLDSYMQKNEIKNVTLAKALNLTEGFISKLRKKKAMPTLFNGLLISKYCNYEVALADLINTEAFNAFEKRKLKEHK